MATEIYSPKIGFSMTKDLLAEWLVADGDQATEGKALFALESDKSTNESDSPATGPLRILMPAGETYGIGTLLGVIE